MGSFMLSEVRGDSEFWLDQGLRASTVPKIDSPFDAVRAVVEEERLLWISPTQSHEKLKLP
jgi:hypothetical protein